MTMPYEYFKSFHKDEWAAVQEALRALAANDDIVIKTTPDHVIGTICENLHGYAAGQAPKVYDPHYGDDRVCVCGHAYYRHFDTYEDMSPVGCKYRNSQECKEFEEAK